MRCGLPWAALESSGKPMVIEAAGRASTPTTRSESAAGTIGMRCRSRP